MPEFAVTYYAKPTHAGRPPERVVRVVEGDSAEDVLRIETYNLQFGTWPFEEYLGTGGLLALNPARIESIRVFPASQRGEIIQYDA